MVFGASLTGLAAQPYNSAPLRQELARCPAERSGSVVPATSTDGNHTDGGVLMPSKRQHALSAILVAGLGLITPGIARAQDADSEFRQGVAAFEEGRFEEAEVHFRNVLKSQPDHVQA